MREPKIELLNCDCMEFMKTAENGYFDCCIADPPYGIDYQSARRTDRNRWKPKILNDEAPYTEWIKPMFDKMNDGGRLICFYRWDVQESFFEAIIQAGFKLKSQIVWDKVIHGMGDLNGGFAPQHELIIYATKGKYEFQKNRPKSVYRCARVDPEKLIHPNEKPVELIAAIIRNITNIGENIVDPFGGSFSTAVACYNEGRGCISTEQHKDYYEAGVKRFENHKRQLQMF